MHNVAARLVVLISGLTLLFFPAHAGAVGISVPIQLTHAENYDPSPSPDGKRLVFITVISGREQLCTMNADGSHIAQLTQDDADHGRA